MCSKFNNYAIFVLQFGMYVQSHTKIEPVNTSQNSLNMTISKQNFFREFYSIIWRRYTKFKVAGIYEYKETDSINSVQSFLKSYPVASERPISYRIILIRFKDKNTHIRLEKHNIFGKNFFCYGLLRFFKMINFPSIFR